MSRWARTLVTEERDSELDLDAWVGQRSATFKFELVNAITGYRVEVHPIRDTVPTLTHDTSRIIKRQITNLFFGVADTALFNSITSRLEVKMLLDDRAFPLGRYVPNSQLRLRFTSGLESTASFYDEMFIVDQEITQSSGSSTLAESIITTIKNLLRDLPIKFTVDSSPYTSTAAWPIGTRRGYALEQLTLDGDYFSPWFDNDSIMRFIRTFNPADAVPTFNLDTAGRVFRDRIIEGDDLIDSPNRFVVISNGASSVGANGDAVVGVFDVPSSAPHSIQSRGFVVQKTERRQLETSAQATAVARNIGQRHTVFETVELQTAPDPRHNSYDVLRWQGSNWLETAWSLPLAEGSRMQHVARKAYGD